MYLLLQNLVLAKQIRSCACSTPSPRFWEKACTHTVTHTGTMVMGAPNNPCPATPSLTPGAISPSKPISTSSRRTSAPLPCLVPTHQEGTTGASLHNMFEALPRGIGHIMGYKGRSFCDYTGLTVGFFEGWGKHERMDKGIKMADHMSAASQDTCLVLSCTCPAESVLSSQRSYLVVCMPKSCCWRDVCIYNRIYLIITSNN